MTENEQTANRVDGLFSLYAGEVREAPKRGRWFWLSISIHVVAVVAVVISPLFAPDEPPPPVDYIRALIYNPPPPPPPPLPKGASSKPADKAPEKTGAKPPDPEVLVEPKVPDDPKPVEPEKGIDPLKQFGVADGSEAGSMDGMAGGVEGGTVGGTLGGTLGGVIGGTGDSPVMDYDQPPRLLKQTRPGLPPGSLHQEDRGRGHARNRDRHRRQGGARPRSALDPSARLRGHSDRAAVGLLSGDQGWSAGFDHRQRSGELSDLLISLKTEPLETSSADQSVSPARDKREGEGEGRARIAGVRFAGIVEPCLNIIGLSFRSASMTRFRRVLPFAALFLSLPLSASADDAKDAKKVVAFGIDVARRGLWQEARFRFEQAVALNPDSASAFNNLGVTLEQQGEFEKARAAYERALALDPSNLSIQQNFDLFREADEKRNRKPRTRGAAPKPAEPAAVPSPTPPVVEKMESRS
jgi:hypothetical protein